MKILYTNTNLYQLLNKNQNYEVKKQDIDVNDTKLSYSDIDFSDKQKVEIKNLEYHLKKLSTLENDKLKDIFYIVYKDKEVFRKGELFDVDIP